MLTGISRDEIPSHVRADVRPHSGSTNHTFCSSLWKVNHHHLLEVEIVMYAMHTVWETIGLISSLYFTTICCI